MNIAIHKVEALSPEAFAALASGPFPCAPRYGRELVFISDPLKRRPLGGQCAFAKAGKVLRCFKGSSLTRLRSCFSPKERFTLEPAETRLSCQMCYRTIPLLARKSGNARAARWLFIPIPDGRGLQAREW